MLLRHVAEEYAASGEFREIQKRLSERPGVSVEGIAPSSFPLIVASLYLDSPSPVLVVADTGQTMQEFVTDLGCFLDDECISPLPPWETLPYEFVSPPETTERDRVAALYRIMQKRKVVTVTSVESIMRRIPDSSFFLNRGITLEAGESYPFDDIIESLASYGYTREQRVEGFGHFAVKGGILDVYLPSRGNPVRLDFFGDTLETIREFDIETQRSIDALDEITIYPRKELILFRKEREALLGRFRESLESGAEFPEDLDGQIRAGSLGEIRGIEDIFPAVVPSATLLSYFDESARIVLLNATEIAARRMVIEKSFHDLYQKRKSKSFCLPPGELLSPGALDDAAARALSLQVFTTAQDSLRPKLTGIQSFHGRITHVRSGISRRIEEGWRVIVTTGFEGQARRLCDLLSELGPSGDFTEPRPDAGLSILITPYREGLEIDAVRTMILSDHEIFGKTYRKKRLFKSKTSRPLESFMDLRPGDYVVHINHGIGIFRNIERMNAGGVERDFFMIDYAEGDKLYVPLDQITFIQKYIGMDGRKPRIDSLGKKSAWNRIKQKVKESVEETARELLKIHSARNAIKGHQFPPDTMWQEEFESLFEYEETPDQITAIEDVKDDMEHTKPMDRLVCGDVGFGKTEVAIRAAFKAVMAGKQVAVLVPTTVLAMQHYETFKKRFQGYPVEIDMISRFRTAGEVTRIKNGMKQGAVDIVIGTHALLARDIHIKNLGLLVIDEEQRFGVRHKEQMKKMRTLVDVMTLSATPIPRTLHMALTGIRDLSIIATPPENRQPIETYVLEENPDILRMAVLHELERKGQIFYVHNRVQTIEAQAEALRKLVPEASFCIAHGQMHEHDLEAVMIDFLEGKYDVLVSTSIIESGLDMPHVNTIIINRADTFGLSQLYQLRGRVGRSVMKAYAYLFYPAHMPLTEEAQKRLQVISEYSELGSGFKIAMKDLEIRGAGNILGREQSGNIIEVGFELYSQMLDDSIRLLKGEDLGADFRTPVFLKTDFYIPKDYIGDERQIMEFYKRFESCGTEEEIDALEQEMEDRFGTAPEIVKILTGYERIRAVASTLRIEEVLEDSRAIRIKLTGQSKIDVKKMIGFISTDRRLSMDPSDNETVVFTPKNNETKKKLEELKKLLQQLS
jgi:transcription-repair coupling factor (superfamily II helicase)